MQKIQLDHKAQPDHLAAELLHQLADRRRRAAGGQHVVDDQHVLPGLNRIA